MKQQLTDKEEALMRIFWIHGPLFVKEIVQLHDEPRPHFNTVSTFVRILEDKGYVAHESFGKTYRYYATVSEEEYGRSNLKNVIDRYFNSSLPSVVSALFRDEDLSDEEIISLIRKVKESNHK